MRELLKGNETLAYAVSQAKVDFIPVFPITPQTSIIESLAEYVQEGQMEAYYVPMESEHSVMAACIGSVSTGVRTFTATSGQGLVYMHELLHWASGSRLPMVMGVVNRALAPGWNIWMDQTDTVSQRDTGWIQIYATNHQEVYDHLFIAYRLAEKVLLPVMLVLDAFFLSHTMGELQVEETAKISAFLPDKPEIPFAVDFDNPRMLGSLTAPEEYMEYRYGIEHAFLEAKEQLPFIYKEFEEKFGRKYQIMESFQAEDAEVLLFLTGTLYETAYTTIKVLREEGIKAGIAKVRFLRPFFDEEIRALALNKKQIIVIDRNFSFGKNGVFADEIKSVLYGLDIPFQSVIAGLGGRDVTANTMAQIVRKTLRGELPAIHWEGEIYE